MTLKARSSPGEGEVLAASISLPDMVQACPSQQRAQCKSSPPTRRANQHNPFTVLFAGFSGIPDHLFLMSELEQERLTLLGNEYLELTDDRKIDRFINNLLVKAVVPELKGKIICDLGIGDMLWTKDLLATFQQVITIEGSGKLVEEASRYISSPKWKTVCCLFENYQPEQRFDTVLASFVLEHVEHPLTLLTRIKSWLNANGELVVIVPNALSLHRRLAVLMGLAQTPHELGAMDRRLGHYHCFSVAQMQDLLVQAGYSIVAIQGYLTKTVPYADMVGLTEQQLSGLFQLGRELPIDMSSIFMLKAIIKS